MIFKRFNSLIFTSFFSLLIITGCQESNDSLDVSPPKNLKNAFNELGKSNPAIQYHSGEASVISMNNDKEIMVSFAASENEYVSTVFVLALENGYENVFFNSQKANILSIKDVGGVSGATIIHFYEIDKYMYLNVGFDSENLKKEISKELYGIKFNKDDVITGYGLSIIDGKWDITDLQNASGSAFSFLQEISLNPTTKAATEVCQSGGPGAESCSGGGCSVTCRSNYYACCILGNCSCVKEEGD